MTRPWEVWRVHGNGSRVVYEGTEVGARARFEALAATLKMGSLRLVSAGVVVVEATAKKRRRAP